MPAGPLAAFVYFTGYINGSKLHSAAIDTEDLVCSLQALSKLAHYGQQKMEVSWWWTYKSIANGIISLGE
jgi:hypothetical protein